MTTYLNFNGVEPDAENTAPIRSQLFHRFPSLFSQEKLAYHIEDKEKSRVCTYRSLLLGYDLEDIVDVLNFEKLQEEAENLVTELQEDLDVGYGSWDVQKTRVFVKTFGGNKKYLWIKFACYYE